MRILTNEELQQKKERKAKRKKIVGIVFSVVVSICIIYNLSLIIQSVCKPDKIPSCFGFKTFSIVSGSMVPELNVGDIIIVKQKDEDDLKIGDVISFRKNSEIITHRIVNMEESQENTLYITKGDNNVSNDIEKIKYEDIEGTMVGKIKKVGLLVLLLKNKLSFLTITIIFVFIYLHDLKKNNKKLIREKKRELYDQLNNK